MDQVPAMLWVLNYCSQVRILFGFILYHYWSSSFHGISRRIISYYPNKLFSELVETLHRRKFQFPCKMTCLGHFSLYHTCHSTNVSNNYISSCTIVNLEWKRKGEKERDHKITYEPPSFMYIFVSLSLLSFISSIQVQTLKELLSLLMTVVHRIIK